MITRIELSAKQKASISSVIRDPALFAKHLLGVELWKRQIELLQSIKEQRRTAVKACHAVGKTFTLAVAALWWLARYHEGIVLTTSPTERQVRTQLWSEIHRLVERAKVPYPKLKLTGLDLRNEHNFAIGFSTNRAASFQGYHGQHVLIIADEAPGIESGIWDAIAGTMAGGEVHIVMSGNPTMPAGAFFDAFTKDRALWSCISIGAFDSPNLEGLDLERLLRLDPAQGGPLDNNPFPYLVTRRWVYEQHQIWWHGTEESSPNWLSRVMARFPEQAQNALFRTAWLDRARERARCSQLRDPGGPLVAGVDVGGAQAETVAYICASRPGRHQVIKLGAWRGEDTRGAVVRFLEPYRRRLAAVRVDAIGIGHNFALHVRDEGFPVRLVNVGLACSSGPELGDNDPAKRFVNDKARFYRTLADIFERNEIEGLNDELTLSQLAQITYDIDSHGRLRIESKERASKRGVRSPDRAEALMLALGQPFERSLPDWMMPDFALMRHDAGHSPEEIALGLQARPDEVQQWLESQTWRSRTNNPFCRSCSVCGKPIELNTRAVRQGSLYYHETCFRQ